MMLKRGLLVFAIAVSSLTASAQSSFYSLFQAGGQFGFANEGYEGAFNGYAVHFVFGKSYGDRAFLGLGFGNETFRGSYRTNDPHAGDQNSYDYDAYMMPIFVDGRLPIGYTGANGRVGILVNAGYAPRIAAIYDKGFLFRGGFFYLYETMGRTDYTVSASYGYQQLTRNVHQRDFQHQHFSISLGLMLK